MRQPHVVAFTSTVRTGIYLVLAVALMTACGQNDGGTGGTASVSADDSEVVEWTESEEKAMRECASGKLGYELTVEIMSADSGTTDGGDDGVNTEAEWETQRWMRAYEQCIFELYADRADMEDPAWQATYRHAYSLDPEGNAVMDDPLAPWHGE
jgi:hypothetical protein